jgi:GNAT superfamily N-acetyltransferase
LDIKEVSARKDLDNFIALPHRIYAQDPLYVSPLKKEIRSHLSEKNPFFAHAEVKYFVAEKNGRFLGRIASVFNRRHLEIHQDGAGFFGFFESVDDPAVSGKLLDAVSDDLKSKGLKTIRGPMNFSTNEECGLLIEGFDSAPMLMTPYNPPYYRDLIEKYGMNKAKDLYAYIYHVRETPPEKVSRVAAICERRGVRARPIDKKRFHQEMLIFKDIYNSSWDKNWGFIPLTDDELYSLGERLKQIVVPELTLIAEDKGRPVGFLGLVPDFNSVLRHMKGRLTPLSILKAFYYSRKITGLRLLLLGIRPEYRNRGVEALLIREAFRAIKRGGYTKVEFSWVLEENIPIQRIIEMADGVLYKTYRIYEKSLS